MWDLTASGDRAYVPLAVAANNKRKLNRDDSGAQVRAVPGSAARRKAGTVDELLDTGVTIQMR